MQIFTIGFSKKTAQQFFGLLKTAKIQRLVDIRLRPSGQLAGFAKQEDLPYFLEHLADGCQYAHFVQLAPTDEILNAYRAGGTWTDYETRFSNFMTMRNVPAILDRSSFVAQVSCLLCSEATPEHCHRRLVAERLQASWDDVEIFHL